MKNPDQGDVLDTDIGRFRIAPDESENELTFRSGSLEALAFDTDRKVDVYYNGEIIERGVSTFSREFDPGSQAGSGNDEGRVVYKDDFEDGDLSEYEVFRFEKDNRGTGDSDVGGYEITEDPAFGDFAVKHQTEVRFLTPKRELSLEPPLRFGIDARFDFLAGVDFVFQFDETSDFIYRAGVRSNFNGQLLSVSKNENPLVNGEGSAGDRVKQGRDESAGFSNNEWLRLEIEWEEDSTLTARTPETGAEVSIQDQELSGLSFAILGYHAGNTGYFDNIRIKEPE
jgi:hypothetical protein